MMYLNLKISNVEEINHIVIFLFLLDYYVEF